MAKTNKPANKPRSTARRKSSGGTPPARNDAAGKLKTVALTVPAKASTPAVEKAKEADIHSIELLEARRKTATAGPGVGLDGGGRYVYGVIESTSKEPTNFGRTGIGGFGEQVYTVHHGDIAAVVSKTSVFIFDP